MATTARNIVKSALRKIHVLGTGASLDPTEADDALSALNDMIASWSAEGNLVFTEQIESFPLVAGTGSYTIGSGGDFDTGRPVKITSAYVRLGDLDYTLTAIDTDEYAKITYKNIQNIPEYYYYNADYPLATIRIYQIPTGGTLFMHSEKYLTGFTDLDTVFSMPPEYEAALKYNLSLWIAPEYEREPSRMVQRIANSTKKTVEAQNRRNNIPRSFVQSPQSDEDRRAGRYNIFSGGY